MVDNQTYIGGKLGLWVFEVGGSGEGFLRLYFGILPRKNSLTTAAFGQPWRWLYFDFAILPAHCGRRDASRLEFDVACPNSLTTPRAAPPKLGGEF